MDLNKANLEQTQFQLDELVKRYSLFYVAAWLFCIFSVPTFILTCSPAAFILFGCMLLPTDFTRSLSRASLARHGLVFLAVSLPMAFIRPTLLTTIISFLALAIYTLLAISTYCSRLSKRRFASNSKFWMLSDGHSTLHIPDHIIASYYVTAIQDPRLYILQFWSVIQFTIKSIIKPTIALGIVFLILTGAASPENTFSIAAIEKTALRIFTLSGLSLSNFLSLGTAFISVCVLIQIPSFSSDRVKSFTNYFDDFVINRLCCEFHITMQRHVLLIRK